jgi:hypothetical protein
MAEKRQGFTPAQDAEGVTVDSGVLSRRGEITKFVNGSLSPWQS